MGIGPMVLASNDLDYLTISDGESPLEWTVDPSAEALLGGVVLDSRLWRALPKLVQCSPRVEVAGTTTLVPVSVATMTILRERLPGLFAAMSLGGVVPVAIWAELRFGGAVAPPVVRGAWVSEAQGVLIGVGLVVAGILSWAGRSAEFDPMRRLFAWLAVGGASVALIFAAGRHGRLDRDRYLVMAMPIVGEVNDANRILVLDQLTFIYNPYNYPRCSIIVRGPVEPLKNEIDMMPDDRNVVCAFAVRYDVVNKIAYPETNSPWWPGRAFSTRDGRPLILETEAIGPSLRPPPRWTLAAGFAIFASLALLLRGRRLRKHARSAASLLNARHLGDGWFELADGDRVCEASAAHLPVGAAVLDIIAPQVTYRTPAVARVVRAASGDREAMVRRLEDRAASYEAIAVAVVLLGTTPLATAMMIML